MQLKQFDLMLRTGSIRIYSSNGNNYEVCDEFHVTAGTLPPEEPDAEKEDSTSQESRLDEGGNEER